MQAVFIVRFWTSFYVIIGVGFIGIKIRIYDIKGAILNAYFKIWKWINKAC